MIGLSAPMRMVEADLFRRTEVAMAERDVVRLVGSDGKRDPDQFGLHGIERCGFGVKTEFVR